MPSTHLMKKNIYKIKTNFDHYRELKNVSGPFTVKRWKNQYAMFCFQNNVLGTKENMELALNELCTLLDMTNEKLSVKNVVVVDEQNKHLKKREDEVFLTISDIKDLCSFKKYLNENNQILRNAANIVKMDELYGKLNSSIKQYNLLVDFAEECAKKSKKSSKSFIQANSLYTEYGTFVREHLSKRELPDVCEFKKMGKMG